MPKNKFQEVVFTLLMVIVMVYGMIVYNVAWHMGGVSGATFLAAISELPVMALIAFVLEFFVIGKIAKKIAFKIVKPTDRPALIILAISTCICAIMCPVMSLIATLLFGEVITFGAFLETWARNMPMALLYQLLYCGPFVRFVFRIIFHNK